MFCAILTLFPGAIRPYLDESILGIAQRQGQLEIELIDFRDYAKDRHRTVDDRPFGGGPGMVLKPEPIFDALEDVRRRFGTTRNVLLCPRGETFSQAKAVELSQEERLLFLCGRYEGFDERIRALADWDEISLGNYVLAGGELGALVVLEAAARLVPGVLGCAESAVAESFSDAVDTGLLDHPHYTRPREFRGMAVPDVLMSGDHEAVARWRRAEALRLTQDRARQDDAEHGAAKPDTAKPDTAKPDTAKPDTAGHDRARHDAGRHETSGSDPDRIPPGRPDTAPPEPN